MMGVFVVLGMLCLSGYVWGSLLLGWLSYSAIALLWAASGVVIGALGMVLNDDSPTGAMVVALTWPVLVPINALALALRWVTR